jgi:hypothetical protein
MLVDVAVSLPFFVFQQKIQCNCIRTIPEIPSDVMLLVLDLAKGHFNAGLIGLGIHNHLFPFFHNERDGSASIEGSPDINALRCRIHRHFWIG